MIQEQQELSQGLLYLKHIHFSTSNISNDDLKDYHHLMNDAVNLNSIPKK